MLRKIHSWPGLIFALILSVTAATGSILAFDAFLDSRAEQRLSDDLIPLPDLTERIVARFGTVEKITKTPAGKLRVTYAENGIPAAAIVDPATGEMLGPESISPLLYTITNLHRAWLSGDNGRFVVGVSAAVMLVLTITGLSLLQRQAGGWHRLFFPLAGNGMRRWHLELGRFAAAGLLLSSATGIYLSLAGFEILPDGASQHEVLVAGSGGPRLALRDLTALRQLTLADMREITLPYAGDMTDPVTLKSNSAILHIDAATGDILQQERHTWVWHIHDLIYRLHTGKGMGWLALCLGLSAAAGTILAMAGIAIWLQKQKKMARIPGNADAAQADILLLVGSEGQTTWGFARSLHTALLQAGRSVHLAAMNDMLANAPQARQLIIMTATAGNGEAPSSATCFIEKLSRWKLDRRPEAIVLGFGDRQFAAFCGYADQVEKALLHNGFVLGMATARINHQSVAEFSAWGHQLADYLHAPLQLKYEPVPQKTARFNLIDREDFGHEVQAPTAILRFRISPALPWLPHALGRALGIVPAFEAGDIAGIIPPGDTRPRYYSIASSARTGILEICVRKLPGGACSAFLHTLGIGDGVTAFIRPNPAFRPNRSDHPLILIGAGAGIAPLIGFLRASAQQRPVHFYWGGRSPSSDFLYQDELEGYVLEGKITKLRTAFSRLQKGCYVQHLIAADSASLRRLVQSGAQILMCGSTDMAEGVQRALAGAIAPLGLDLAMLRQNGRLLEDVY